jgi:hypothetical protein
MAYAGAEFTEKILRAIKGETGITAPTYVNLASDRSGGEALKKELGKEIEYFSTVVELDVSIFRNPSAGMSLPSHSSVQRCFQDFNLG